MSDKLLTLAEAARHLDLSEAEVVHLTTTGALKVIRLGGDLLRFHPEDVAAWQASTRARRPPPPTVPPAVPAGRGSWWERARDFLYAYDFYLLAMLIIGTIIGLIVAT